MSDRSARLSLGFSCIGHTYSHLFQPIFYVTVLSLEGELGLSHGEVVSLVVAGGMLYGFAAPLAGWLADRWSSVGMMAVFYLGTGAAMMVTGLADTAMGIGLALALTGLFGSIYHPVGIAWLVRNSVNTGTVLGINGIFGGLGPALAAIMTGALIDLSGWRIAFILPGAVVAATGLVFIGFVAKGWILDTKTDRKPPPPAAARADMIRAFAVLAFVMFCGGIIYNAIQPALPKSFAAAFGADDGSLLSLSSLVAAVYVSSGLMQVVGGWLADKFPVRRVYLYCYLAQVPFLILVGLLGGPALVLVAIFAVCSNSSSLPAENILIARYAPPERRGLVFGIKYVVAIGFASVGILLEGFLFDATGGFAVLFAVLAGCAALATVAILKLPGERPAPVAQAQAAE